MVARGQSTPQLTPLPGARGSLYGSDCLLLDRSDHSLRHFDNRDSQYLGDCLPADVSGRWYINESGESRFALFARRPTNPRCNTLPDQHEEWQRYLNQTSGRDRPLVLDCNFEWHHLLDSAAPFDLQPLFLSSRFRSSHEDGVLWIVLSHAHEPKGAPVECTSEFGRVISQSTSVSDDGTIFCKVRTDDPEATLTIRVGNARLEIGLPADDSR